MEVKTGPDIETIQDRMDANQHNMDSHHEELMTIMNDIQEKQRPCSRLV
jgi:hypothetical protein